MAIPEETRNLERIAVKIPLIFRVDRLMEKDFTLTQKEVKAAILDLSASGISVLSNVYIPEGIVLEIEFDSRPITNKAGKIEIKGEVVSSRMMGGQYRLGVSIKEIKEEDKDSIARFLQSRKV